MPNPIKIRIRVLAAHGTIFLLLGLALFYLRATMTSLLFEAVATVIAILLSAAALLMAALTDWIAAFTSEVSRLHKTIYYVLAGALLAAVGFYVGMYPEETMMLLLLIAAAHACAAVLWSAFFAWNPIHPLHARLTTLLLGTISLIFAILFITLRHADNPEATGLLGAYTSFVGVKMFFFAWRLRSLATELIAGRVTTLPGTPKHA